MSTYLLLSLLARLSHKTKGTPVICWMVFQITLHTLLAQSTLFISPPYPPKFSVINTQLNIFKCSCSWRIEVKLFSDYFLTYFLRNLVSVISVFVSHNTTHTYDSHHLIYILLVVSQPH